MDFKLCPKCKGLMESNLNRQAYACETCGHEVKFIRKTDAQITEALDDLINLTAKLTDIIWAQNVRNEFSPQYQPILIECLQSVETIKKNWSK